MHQMQDFVDVPLTAVEAVKERLARGDDVRATRASRKRYSMSVILSVVNRGATKDLTEALSD